MKAADRTYQGAYALGTVDDESALTISFGVVGGGDPEAVWDYEYDVASGVNHKKVEGERLSVLYVRPEGPTKPDPRLVGSWKVISTLHSGEEVKSRPRESVRISFKDGKMTTSFSGGQFTRLYRVDSSKNPATIDSLYDRGDGQLDGEKGIYVFKGKTLVICMAVVAGVKRPREFASRQGDSCTLDTLVRDDAP